MENLSITTPAAGSNGPKAKSNSLFFNFATADAWAHSFLRHLESALHQHNLPPTAPHIATITQAAQQVFNQTIVRAWQPNSRLATVIGACSLLLESHHHLQQAGLRKEQALAVVKQCFDLTYHAFLLNVCKPLYQEAGFQPQRFLKINFAHWSAGLLALREHTLDLQGYAYFLRSHGADELTLVVEQADLAWMRKVHALCKNTAAAQAAAPAQSEAASHAASRATAQAACAAPAAVPDDFLPFQFAPEQANTAAARKGLVFGLVKPQQASMTEMYSSGAQSGQRRTISFA
jgi:hypothetical protein